MAGLADGEGHLTKTYRYGVTGELTYGSAAYENEYTYNGESYNPNIHSQYLRARYYNVVTANFLTEDSYLGNINEPLTLNRYNCCISSYLNYVDPSGNVSILPVLGPILPPFPVPSENTDTKGIAWDFIQQAGNAVWNQVRPTAQAIISFDKGVAGSLVKAFLDKPLVSLMPAATVGEHLRNVFRGRTLLDPMQDKSQTLGNEWSPTRALKDKMFRNEAKVQALAGNVENVNAYYIGRCTGDAVVYAAGLLEVIGGIFTAGSGGSALVAETASVAGLAAAPVTIIAIAGGAAIAIDGGAMALHGVDMIREDMGRYQESKKKEGERSKENSETGKNGIYERADYHSGQTTGRKNPAPKDGQFALDNSVPIGDNTSRRIGLDRNGDFVVLDETTPGKFHGHIREWNSNSGNQGLSQEMKNALYKAGYIKSPTGSSFKLTNYAENLINK